MKFLTIIVSTLIIIAVLIPGSNIPSVELIGFDKFVHITMFLSWAVALKFDVSGLKSWMVISFGLLFSLLTEILQLFVEGRSFDWFDMVADLGGLLIGVVIAPTFARVVNKISNRKH